MWIVKGFPADQRQPSRCHACANQQDRKGTLEVLDRCERRKAQAERDCGQLARHHLAIDLLRAAVLISRPEPGSTRPPVIRIENSHRSLQLSGDPQQPRGQPANACLPRAACQNRPLTGLVDSLRIKGSKCVEHSIDGHGAIS